MSEFRAHSSNKEGESHGLLEHLRAVAAMASDFSRPFGGEEAAYYAGLWHDIGKFDPEFQRYLSGKRVRGPDHKGAGTKLACQHLGLAGLIVQGHHGGLRASSDLRGWLAEKGEAYEAVQALEHARRAMSGLEPSGAVKIPEFVNEDPVKAELWVRMVFSAVVDADFLDTERHFSPNRTTVRDSGVTMQRLWEHFQARHRETTSNAVGQVNEIRSQVYDACLDSADRPTGVFRLTVPTGGGKTLSAMGFALRHAVIHGLKRVIVATPYMSITQQTASVYRGLFEDYTQENFPVVLEHHSMAETDDGEEYEDGTVWQRLAAENWDAPVVVTTTVQLFNSLFSNRTSATRKLHRLAESVIILDEAQSLPPSLLTPILDVLNELTKNYGASVVLSTATQPAFEVIKAFADVPATDIVPGYRRHFEALKRVNYEWRTPTPLPWEDVAKELEQSPQSLAVVNTKKDALNLLDVLGDESALHLSTYLCGRHRQRTIEEIRERLATGQVCRVVSTQVVEAGVDLDFPMVMRAIGPMDSIIQAAGRCNRSGLEELGRMVVFRPVNSTPPSGDYRTATQLTMSMLSVGPLDMDDPQTVTEFFRRRFAISDADARRIQGFRKVLDFPEVARLFRMIDQETADLIVSGYGTSEERKEVDAALAQLRSGSTEARILLRRVLPYTVHIYLREAPRMERSGLITNVMPGVYEWLGDYDPVTGIGGITSMDPDRLIV